MTLKAWSSTLLILCFSFAAWAQKGNSYLEKPLPQGWGTGTAHTIPGDDNLFYNPQIQISAESETKRSIFREKDKTKRSKKESAQHSKSRNKSFVMTSVSAL